MTLRTHTFEPLTLLGQCRTIGSNHILFLARTVAEGLPIMSSNRIRAPPFQLSSLITFNTSRDMFAWRACATVSSECSWKQSGLCTSDFYSTMQVNIQHDPYISQMEIYMNTFIHMWGSILWFYPTMQWWTSNMILTSSKFEFIDLYMHVWGFIHFKLIYIYISYCFIHICGVQYSQHGPIPQLRSKYYHDRFPSQNWVMILDSRCGCSK